MEAIPDIAFLVSNEGQWPVQFFTSEAQVAYHMAKEVEAGNKPRCVQIKMEVVGHYDYVAPVPATIRRAG